MKKTIQLRALFIVTLFFSAFLLPAGADARECSWRAIENANAEIAHIKRKLRKRDGFSPENFIGELFRHFGEYAEEQPDAGPLPDIFQQLSQGLQQKSQAEIDEKIRRLEKLRRWKRRCEYWLHEEEQWEDYDYRY